MLCLTFRSSSVPRGCGSGFVSLVTTEVRGALRVLALLEICLVGWGFIPPWMVPRREQIFVVTTGLITASQGRALPLPPAGQAAGRRPVGALDLSELRTC